METVLLNCTSIEDVIQKYEHELNKASFMNITDKNKTKTRFIQTEKILTAKYGNPTEYKNGQRIFLVYTVKPKYTNIEAAITLDYNPHRKFPITTSMLRTRENSSDYVSKLVEIKEFQNHLFEEDIFKKLVKQLEF